MGHLIKFLDKLIPCDRLASFFYGFWLVSIFFIVYRFFLNQGLSLLAAFGTILVIAVLKEIYLAIIKAKEKVKYADILYMVLPGLVMSILLAYNEGIVPLLNLINELIK